MTAKPARLTRSNAPWLHAPAVQQILALLNANQPEDAGRLVGGCVRNALWGAPVADIDIATRLLPTEVMQRAEGAGLRCIPTGLSHGTVTVIVDHQPFEITTLRRDIATDGRHAEIAFTTDWQIDAARRDFTINALYASADGKVHDYFHGLDDLEARRVVFIGDADARIEEDYLRILRFFRFSAWYARDIDATGLAACARGCPGLQRISAERIWAELKKLLAASDPSRAMAAMQTHHILERILPEAFDLSALASLLAWEAKAGQQTDAMVRLAAGLAPAKESGEALARAGVFAQRLRFSNEERAHLAGLIGHPLVAMSGQIDERDLRAMLYQVPGLVAVGRVWLAFAATAVSDGGFAGLAKALAYCAGYQRPVMPVQAADVMARGLSPGPQLGKVLKGFEAAWMSADFPMDAAKVTELMDRVVGEIIGA